MSGGSDYSIKSKILASLIVIPFVMLTFFLLWSLRLFQNDKIAYIFDTASTISSSLSTQISTKLKQTRDQSNVLTEKLGSNFEWSAETPGFFSGFDSIDGFSVFESDKIVALLERNKDLIKSAVEQNAKLGDWLAELEKSTDFLEYDEVKDLLFYGFRVKSFKLILLLNSKQVISSIRKPGPFIVGLLDKSDKIVISTEGTNQQSSSAVPFSYQEINTTKVIKNENDEEYLIAYSPLQEVPFTLATAIKKSDALSVVNSIFRKSILIFVVLLASSIIIGILITEEITVSLADILDATHKITEGFFNIKVKMRRDDEVGSIARSINIMAIEIRRLLKETEDKVRMEHELKVAQVLQTTFFPEEAGRYGGCHVVGKFDPASECSGDWWYHLQHNGRVYFFIGDATGHGVSAALLTGTVFTALKIILKNSVELSEIFYKLNEVVFQVFRGQIMMTFLIAEYNPDSRNLKYINASHDPPIVLRKSAEKLNRHNLEWLNNEIGPRLGQKSESEYNYSSISLNTGDRVFFYTDGVFDIKNKELKLFSERNLLQYLTECHHIFSDLLGFKNEFYKRLKEFQHQASHDDVTFFAMEIES